MLSIGGGARFAVGLTLKPIVDDFGWGRSELGLAVALLQVVSAATMFGAGHLAYRMGPQLVLGGGLLVSGIGIGVMSLITLTARCLACARAARGDCGADAARWRDGIGVASSPSGVSESFGTRHLGALTGLITMVHQIFVGIGAYLGAAVFDATGTYDTAFKTMLAVSLVAVLLLRHPRLFG